MKILKILGIALAGIVVLALLLGAVAKKEYTVERSVRIDRPHQQVFEYIRFVKNQDHFSVWAKMDPAMKREFRGTDGMVGFVSAWDSQLDDVGKGEQEITKIVDGQRIDLALRFIEPFESNSEAYMTTSPVSERQTEVLWGFHGRMNYPMNLMMLFMDFDGMIGKDLGTGLENLKTILEAK